MVRADQTALVIVPPSRSQSAIHATRFPKIARGRRRTARFHCRLGQCAALRLVAHAPQFAINLKMAKALDLVVPEMLLATTDKVIE
jgi:hypothetical protein